MVLNDEGESYRRFIGLDTNTGELLSLIPDNLTGELLDLNDEGESYWRFIGLDTNTGVLLSLIQENLIGELLDLI